MVALGYVSRSETLKTKDFKFHSNRKAKNPKIYLLQVYSVVSPSTTLQDVRVRNILTHIYLSLHRAS